MSGLCSGPAYLLDALAATAPQINSPVLSCKPDQEIPSVPVPSRILEASDEQHEKQMRLALTYFTRNMF